MSSPDNSRNGTLQYLKSSLRQTILAALVLIAVLFAPLLAQTLDSSIKDPKAAQAIRDSAQVLAHNNTSGAVVQQLGYRPPNDDLWRTMPAVRQVEAAYIAAENAAPARGGDQMLALLSQDLAQQYGKAQLPNSLQRYSEVKVEKPPAFLVRPRYATPPVLTNPEAAARYQSLYKYLQGSGLGGPTAVLQDYLELPAEVANGIVATSQDMSEAFKRAINWVPEQERAPRVAQMVADVDAKYGAAAKSDHGLDIFRKRAASPTAQASLGPMVAPPLEIPRFRERVAPPSYSRFVATNYTSETMVFTKMIEIKAGFGGVVFGSEVRPDPALGKLNSVQWAADPADRSKGVLQFKFDGGATRTWGPVLYEDALTAMKMVSGGPNFPNWKPGDGIGLVGIDVEHPATYQSCSKDCAIQAARRWNLILHPVLTDKGLGWSAIMVDALPTNPAYFSELAKGKIGDAALQQLVDWERSNPGNYKFIDVPIRIVPVEGEGLSVLPMTPAAQRAGSPAVFLAVKPFGSEQKKETFQSAFPAVAPTLLKISVYHDRLNRFAPVLGIMRWARMSDAKIEVAGGTLNSVPTPGSVAIPDSGVVPLDAFETENSAREESVAAIDHTAAALIEALPAAVRGKITERRLAAARIRGYQVRIEAASNEMIPLSESNLAWVGRLAAKLEDIPDVKTAYQEIVGRISKAGSAAEKAFGTDEFAASLSELIGEQDRLNTWLHKAAPDFANERKQLDVKSYDLMRSMSEYLERIGEIRASMSSEEERRQVLIAQLPAASQTAYQGFIEERESSAKRATELNEEAESLAAASRDPARRNEALAAVPAEGQAMIREAEARADSLRQKAWAAEDEKTIRSAFDAAQKASDAAEQLRQKYLAGWYRENEKRRAEAVARFAEADGADKAAGAADDQARKILESAYPQIACIENLLAWSIDGVDE